MFKLLQRYLATSFIKPFVVGSLFFISFLLTFQLFRITRIVVNKDVDWMIIIELVGHIAVSFLPMAVPLSALFATIYTLNKMSEDSEIVAMRSFGLTKFKLFSPFLMLGILISITIFSLNKSLIPYSKTQFKNTIVRLTSRGMLTSIKAENFFTDIPNVTLFSEKVSDEGTKLENVFIRQTSKGNEEESIIIAKHGNLIKKAKGKWSLPTLRLHLQDGNIVKTKKGQKDLEKVIFQNYDFPIVSGGALGGFVTKDSMRTNSELGIIIEEQRIRLEGIQSGKLKGSLKNEIKWQAKSKLEFWSRFNTPLQCLVFIFLGFSLGIKKGRGRQKNTGAIGFLVLILYYTVFFLGVSLSRKGVFPPALTVFMPSLLTLIVGSIYYKKLDWAS